MYTKFYDNTLTTKFIKELVAKTNVPFINTWKPGDFAIRGNLYLARDAIWECQHTGLPNSIDDICSFGNNSPHVSENYTNDELRFFKRVCPYVFGEEYYGITGRYESKILGYDNTTHFYLGQYLRMMRDMFNLDMMPFYNCFGGEYLADVDFDSNGNVQHLISQNSGYKILSVPVRFGQTYMISIDSETPIECVCAIYGSKGLLKELTDNLNDVEGSESNGHNTYNKYQRMQFQHPVFYTTISWHQLYSQLDDNEKVINDLTYDQRLGQFERYLRLLIKIPKSNSSSVVVIEGDYGVVDGILESENTPSVTWSNQYLQGLTVNSKTVTGDWIRPEIIEADENNKQISNKIPPLLSPLSLLQINDGNIYAFSDRLIEYLTQNVINHLDTFGKNVERIQQYSKSNINKLKNGTIYSGAVVPGVWDEDLQQYLFELSKNSLILNRKLDLNGYVDKDTETVITRGQLL